MKIGNIKDIDWEKIVNGIYSLILTLAFFAVWYLFFLFIGVLTNK